MANIKNGKGVVNESSDSNKNKNKTTIRIMAVCAMVLALIYIVLPYDFDDTLIGRIDDFMLFMSAFCFVYSQFLSEVKARAKVLLNLMSLVFCVLWVIIYIALLLFM